MSPKLKQELISFAHTFIPVFVLAVSLNSSLIDPAHLTKEGLAAFSIAVLRSAWKLGFNTLVDHFKLSTEVELG